MRKKPNKYASLGYSVWDIRRTIREAEYAFGDQIVEVGDFMLQSVRAKHQIENGATEVEMRLKNGEALTITVNQFENAYNQVAAQYITQCNDRDSIISNLRNATTSLLLEDVWNTAKTEIGL